MKALYFVRHGQSQDNAADLWSRPESPLTEQGRSEALEAAKSIKDQGLNFDLMIVSTLPRALETAQIIADEIGHPPELFDTNELFVERSFGDLTGTLSPDFWNQGKTMEHIDEVPGAEKLADMHVRAARSLDHLKTRPEERILLVGHGSFARALRRVINNQPHTDEYLPNLVRYNNGEVARLI